MTTAPVDIVGNDLECVRCRYQLRGLAVSGRCPECAAQVIRSVRGDLFELASPEYVRSLRTAASIVYWAVAAGLSLPSAMMCCAFVFAFSVSGVWFENVSFDLIKLAFLIAGAFVLVVLIFGWWSLARRDPEAIGVDEGVTARGAVRGSLVLLCMAVIVATVWVGEPSLFGSVPKWIVVTVPLVLVIGGVGVHLVAAGVYLGSLGRRLPNKTLVGRAKFQVYCGATTLLAGALTLRAAYFPPLGFFGVVVAAALIGGGITYAKAIEDAKFTFDKLKLVPN